MSVAGWSAEEQRRAVLGHSMHFAVQHRSAPAAGQSLYAIETACLVESEQHLKVQRSCMKTDCPASFESIVETAVRLAFPE